MKKIIISLALASIGAAQAAYIYQFTNLTGAPVDIRITAAAGNDQRQHVFDGETVAFNTGIACLSSISVDAVDFWGTTGPDWKENSNNDKAIVDKSFYTIPSTGANLMCGGFSGKFYLTNAGKLAFKQGDFRLKAKL